VTINAAKTNFFHQTSYQRAVLSIFLDLQLSLVEELYMFL